MKSLDLKQYCKTDTEAAYVEAYQEHYDNKTWAEIADLFGKKENTVRLTVKRVKDRAAIQGDMPELDLTHPVPDTHVVKGVSTLYDEDGGMKMQWVKSDLKKEAVYEAFEQLILGMRDEIKPLDPVPYDAESDITDPYLLTMYNVADTHLGMLAWKEESGENYDLDKGESLLCRWFDKTIEQSPDSGTCIINCLGDLIHYDSYDSVTPTNKNLLDTDSRYPEIVRAGIRCIRYIIHKALTKHHMVNLIVTTGNHDPSSTVWLRELFSSLYENEPRVFVETKHKNFLAYRYGNVMFGFHHGHTKQKGTNLALLFATDYPEIWGQTVYRYVHTGHLHHLDIKEHPGIIIEQHSTIAANDAHAANNGYRSMKKATSITYHREHGEVGRTTVTPGMLKY